MSTLGKSPIDLSLSGTTAPRRRVPSGCFATIACSRLGMCGRDRCVVNAERDAFAGEIEKARAGSNPHRVPEFDAERKVAGA